MEHLAQNFLPTLGPDYTPAEWEDMEVRFGLVLAGFEVALHDLVTLAQVHGLDGRFKKPARRATQRLVKRREAEQPDTKRP